MKSRILTLALCLFLTGCTSEYDEHARLVSEGKNPPIQTAFHTENIPEYATDVIAWPDTRALDRLLSIIGKARTRLDYNVYLFTREDVADALIEAKKRSVQVRVILEKNVYQMPRANDKIFSKLKDAWVDVTWAPEKTMNFDHAKYVASDTEWMVATANTTLASFAKNREFFIFGTDGDILATLRRTFDADFAGTPVPGSLTGMLIAPIDAREKTETLLKNAKKSIFVFSENVSDERIIAILREKSLSGLDVKVCVAKKTDAAGKKKIQALSDQKIAVTQAKNAYVHAKSFLVDDTFLSIGSANFTTNSLDNNREIGLILRNTGTIAEYRKLVKKDCPFDRSLVR